MHQAATHQDLTHPGAERRVAAELRKRGEHLHEAVLEEVFRRGTIRHEPPGQRERRACEQSIQGLLGRGIPRSGPAQQRRVSFDVKESSHMH